jgi:hypothetical protein
VFYLLEGLAGEGWEDKGGLVDVGGVVAVEVLFLLWGPLAERGGEVAVGVLAADHEANLTGWVGWDGGVGVLDVREDLSAVTLELGDQVEVKPLALACWESKSQRGDANGLKGGREDIPWVVMTPPSRRAPWRSSKYGFWNKLSAGPSGSEESVMMTSKVFW